MITYKFYLSLLVLCFLVRVCAAQNLINIKGTVIDSGSRSPIRDITVNLMSVKIGFVKSTLTKEDGSFLIENVKSGIYMVKVLAVAYQSHTVQFIISDTSRKNINLGKISLTAKKHQLKELTITHRKPTIVQEVDRIVYDVSADPDSKTENMLEVFRKVPMLSLDEENQIKLKGSTEFKIFVNGKPSGIMASNPAMALRTMRGKNVKKIEVITTPSSKYDSEGTAGIINIITNSNLEGHNIILEVFKNTLYGPGFGGAFTVKKNKFGANGYVGKWFQDFPTIETTTFRSIKQGSVPSVEQVAHSKSTGAILPFNTDLSYEIDSLNLLTSSLVFSLEDRKLLGDQFLKSSQNSYRVDNITYITDKKADFALNYQLGFKRNKDSFLTASYKYLITNGDYDNTNKTILANNYPDYLISQQNNSGLTEKTAQLDYVGGSKKLTVEGGLKLIDRNSYSDFNTRNDFGNTSIFNSDEFNYNQQVYSIYNSYQLKQKSWTLKTGVRLERTIISAEFITFQSNLALGYTNVIPSFSAQRKLGSNSGLNFGYTQRIARPSILQLNPFENRFNPLVYTSGNPELKPVISNNFDLAYTRSAKGNFNFNLSYVYADQTIQEVSTLGSDQITRFRYENTGRNIALGGNLSVNYPIGKYFRINVSGLVQQVWTEGTVNGIPQSNKGLQYTSNSDFSYTLKGNWKLGFLAKNYGPLITLQGKTTSYISTAFRLNKEFFNNKVGMIFNAYNVFPAYRVRTTTLVTPDFYERVKIRKLAQGVYFNFYYNIGQLKEKVVKNKRGVKNDDQDKKKADPNEL